MIAAIRAVSDSKITLGGFGFSMLPEEIMHCLRPDLGVFGGPDAFFAHFEDIQAGNFGEVANLLYFQGGQLISNPRVFHPPLADTEYTPQAIAEMMAFYDSFPSPGFEGAPIEINRNTSLLTHLKTYAKFEHTRLDQMQAQETSQSTEQGSEENAQDRMIGWSLFLGNPATTTETIRNTLQVANQEGLAQLFNSCHLNTDIRVFDYEKPDEATLAVTYSVSADLERTSYQPILPSFAYPPALLKDFGSEEEIVQMFKHIAETYLSTKYQKSRDWFSFVRQETSAAAITGWMAELSDTQGIRVPVWTGTTTTGKASATLQRLFSEELQDEERDAGEHLAKQVVDTLLAACLEAFPDLFGSLGLPTTMDRIEQVTPYEVAVAVLGRWCTEKELVDELAEHTQSVLSESMQDLTRFCVEVMLHRSAGLGWAWWAYFKAMATDEAFQAGPCRDEPHQIFLHQAILSTLVAKMLDWERLRLLPPEYNYPLNLLAEMPPDRRALMLNSLVNAVYEDAFPWDKIEVQEPLRSWLAERLPKGEP